MRISEVIGKVRTFLRSHRFIVIGLIVFGICFGVGNTMKSGVDKEIASREATLSGLKNQITMEENKAQKVQEIVAEPDHGLSTSRWQTDDTVMTNWITPAFSWTNLAEYQQNRQFYVERLGSDDPFLTEFLVEKNAGYGFLNNYRNDVDTGEDINMHMKSFKSYVYAIDEATGVYSYVAVVSVASFDKNGNEGTSTSSLILMYDVTPEGEVEDFKCCVAIT